ncbi:MAG: hypothetical protein GY704_10900, partial [Phycisphaeraceae bacterium]|nr:hypothetical protein [Phycisphaeraceae bacterium]
MANEKAVVVGAGGIFGAWVPHLKREEVDVVGLVDLRLEAGTTGLPELLREFGVTPPAELSGAGAVAVEFHGPVAAPSVTIVATGRDLGWAGEGPCRLRLDARTEDGEVVMEELRLETPRGPIVAEGRWPAELGLHPFRLQTAPLDAIRGRARCGSLTDGDVGGLRLDGLETWLPPSSGVR